MTGKMTNTTRRMPNPPLTGETLVQHPEQVRKEDVTTYRFSPTTLFQIQIGIASSAVEEETLVGDLLSNRSFRLNPTGAHVWRELLGGEKTFADIAQKFQSEYQLDSAASEEIVAIFLHELVVLGLIVVSTDGAQTVHAES